MLTTRPTSESLPTTFCRCKFQVATEQTAVSKVRSFLDVFVFEGHWYGDQREFNYLTVFNTTKMIGNMSRKFKDDETVMEALKNMAISCGHAELTSQAYYLGFSHWKNVTYPLMGQFIFTNGQDFSLANYQLNNLELWNKASSTNNLCFLTKPRWCVYDLGVSPLVCVAES